MKYIFDVFYDSAEKADIEYDHRFNLDSTIKSGLSFSFIDNPGRALPYFVYNGFTTKLMDDVRLNDGILISIVESLPKISKKEFFLNLVVSEITNSAACEEITLDSVAIYNSAREIIDSQSYNGDEYDDMIKGYYSIISMKDFSDLKIPTSAAEVREIYDDILAPFIKKRNAPDGKYFRTNDTYVKTKGYENKPVVNIGTSGEENIIDEIEYILGFSEDDNMPLLLRVIIMMYHLIIIRPFYDGNQRLARYIASLKLREGYSCGTCLSLGRGTFAILNDFYERSNITLSKVNMGELNSFVDNQLTAILMGQKTLINYIKNRKSIIREAMKFFEKNEHINSDIKLEIMKLMVENHCFNEYNQGFLKERILDEIKMDASDDEISLAFKELIEDRLIIEFDDVEAYKIDFNYFKEMD